VDSSCFFCLFNKVSLSSSSSDWDIIIVLLSVLGSSSFSFLKEICARFKGLLFFMNLSLRVSFLLFSSCGSSFCFFFFYGFAPLTGNHF
jgi:hypothetical protein